MPRPTVDVTKITKAAFDYTVPINWKNAGGSNIDGGSWWDSTATGNGTSAWATQTVTDTNTVELVSFNVTALFQAIYDNSNWCSAIIIGATGSGTSQLFAGKTYSDSAKRPKISYDGGADQAITDECTIGNGVGAGSQQNAAEQYVSPDLGTSEATYTRWILVVPPPITRPTSATLKVYTTQQFGDQDVKVFWLRYPPESAPFLTSYTYARPASDITKQWTPSSGTDHFAMIDEVTASDADYISATAAGQTTEVKLAAMTQPQAGTNVAIGYRVQGITGAAGVTVSMVQGTTVIATDTNRTSNGDYVLTVASGTWASVTDWTDIRLRFVST
jgi:hypothetical protein